MQRRIIGQPSWRDTLAPPLPVLPPPRLPAPVEGGGRRTGGYSDFRVLLDDPATLPGLRFDDYAHGLADLIRQSRPAFAVGIFGGWGTGKTTLMRRVEMLLSSDEQVVTVWFTAWRYEKEPHLIVPLLDVLRETLEKRADRPDVRARLRRRRRHDGWVRQAGQPAGSAWAHEAAVKVAKAGQAFLAGLTVSATLPGFQATFSPGPVIQEITARKASPGPLSFYHAGFCMLNDAIKSLADNGTRRLVIFVDDLDRCLAPSAMELLESMKIFFDVAGCIFVAGLDMEIAERALATKVAAAHGAQPTGADYVSKIFQVPFTLPLIGGKHLRSYLDTIEASSDFGKEQRANFRDTVRSHLTCLEDAEMINPREIKRLINSYIVQLKMLSPQLGDQLEPAVVLALVCMNFRADWKEIYSQLAADPLHFQSILRDMRKKNDWAPAMWMSGTEVVLPSGLVRYLTGHASPLLDVPNLPLYISAAESTWSIDPSVLEARTIVSRLRRSVDELTRSRPDWVDAASQLQIELDQLSEHLRSLRGLLGSPQALRNDALAAAHGIADRVGELALTGGQERGEQEQAAGAAEAWAEDVSKRLDDLALILRELQRYVSVGA